MTENQKKRMLNHDALDIVLADLDKILYLNDDDVLYIYDGDDYYTGHKVTGEKTYEDPLFSIGASEIKLGSFLSPRFALAKVWHVEHCDDGIFRVALDPKLWHEQVDGES